MVIAPKYKAKPQLSANQFSEYLSATPVRRRGILKAAKHSNTPAPVRYSVVRTAISRFLCSKPRDWSIIENVKNHLEQEKTSHLLGTKTLSDFSFSDVSLSLEAIETFTNSVNKIVFPGHTMTLGEHRPPKLMIGQVSISVRPDVIVAGTGKDLKPLIGGVLLSFGKDAANQEPQRKEMGQTAAALIHLYADQELAKDGVADRKFCMSFDVFGKAVHVCPNSYKSRKDNMEAAAQEIALLWPTI